MQCCSHLRQCIEILKKENRSWFSFNVNFISDIDLRSIKMYS